MALSHTVPEIDFLGSPSLSGRISQLGGKIWNKSVFTRIFIWLIRAEVETEPPEPCVTQLIWGQVGCCSSSGLTAGSFLPTPSRTGWAGRSRRVSGGLCLLSPLNRKDSRLMWFSAHAQPPTGLASPVGRKHSVDHRNQDTVPTVTTQCTFVRDKGTLP